MLLDKTSILGVKDLKKETVSVPEWGGDVVIQEMSALVRDRLSAETMKDGVFEGQNYFAKTLVRSITGDDGSLIFSEADEELLAGKSPVVLARLFKVASRLNGVMDEDAIKNSAPGLTESLPLDCA
jgi:hypothetical protein